MGHAPAGFWRRAGALAIDGALLAGVWTALGLVVALLARNDSAMLARLLPVDWSLTWAYFALMESSPAQGTVGKMALGLRVVDRLGAPISFRRASARYWLKVASTIPVMGGWGLAALPPRKLALHDVLAGTAVVRGIKLGPVRHWDPTVPALNEYWDGSRWVGGAR
jgi:uncharacterized RDD family membrane protein YckC